MASSIPNASSSSIDAFAASIGINAHLHTGYGAYGDFSKIQSSLEYIGIKTIRDVFANASADEYAVLATHGYKMNFILPSLVDYGGPQDVLARLGKLEAFVDKNPGSVVAVEGPNEVDNWGVKYNGSKTISSTMDLQKILYDFVKSDASFQSVDVYGFTLGSATNNADLQTKALVSTSDAINLHMYTSTDGSPGNMLQRTLDKVAPGTEHRPIVITETGFTTVSTKAYMGVDQNTQAVYTLKLMLDSFKAGVEKTFLYELFDSAPDPTGVDPEKHFGLFKADGTPKLAATAVHNLMSILDDGPGTATTSGSTFSYSLPGSAASISDMVLDRADGGRNLIVWKQERSWDGVANKALSVAEKSMTIHLNERYDVVKVFDPMAGSAPIAIFRNVDAVPVRIGERPVIIEVSVGFQAGDGRIVDTAANIADRLPVLQASEHLTSISLTDTHVLPVASEAAMKALIAQNGKALSAIEGDYSFSVQSTGTDLVQVRHFDQSGKFTSLVSDYYSGGAKTLHRVQNADGSTGDLRYKDGVVVGQTLTRADASRQEYTFGIKDQAYVTRVESYDASGRTTSVAYKRADDTIAQTWEKLDNGTIVDKRFEADGSSTTDSFVKGVLKSSNGKLGDGSSLSITYNSDGSKATESILHADKHRETFVYGVKNAAYTTEHNVFDASGKLSATFRTHADGSPYSTYVVKPDASNFLATYEADGDIVSAVVKHSNGLSEASYFKDGLLTSETIVLPDRARQEFKLNIENQVYSSRIEEYDPSGKTTSVVYTRADGTLEHTWQKLGDGSIVDTRFDAEGDPISRWTQSATGTQKLAHYSGAAVDLNAFLGRDFVQKIHSYDEVLSEATAQYVLTGTTHLNGFDLFY